MTQIHPSNQPEVIRITHEQARSGHVDDLLKRQMSLRGELGITRDRQSRWYRQNWFVFMVAGGLAALAAWAILEPFLDDLIYLQGPVQEEHAEVPQVIAMNLPGVHAIRVNNQTILVSDRTRLVGGGSRTFDPRSVKRDQVLGLHVEWLPQIDPHLAFADFVDEKPPVGLATDPQATLDSLSAASHAAGMLLFPVVAAFIGLGIGAADGAVCHLLRRALLAGAIGLLVGFLGGFVCSILANVAYAPLTELASRQQGDDIGSFTTFGFIVQMGARSLAWALAGVAMGLGQGLALRSGKLMLYGLLGGILGGLLGGLLFDPIDFIIVGSNHPSAHWARLIGLVVIGATVGAMIGIVELLARDAWLCMTQGPLAGKEFLVFKDTMRLGASPRSDIYLFNDEQVADQHAILRASGDAYELENLSEACPVTINGRPVRRSRLRHGDQIGLGRTLFTFNCKRRD